MLWPVRWVNLLFLLLLLSISCSSSGTVNREDTLKGRRREGRLFSLFSVVNFQNGACRSTSSSSSAVSTFRNGTCFTTSECSANGGTVAGSCASGFGVCCVFILSNAATTVRQNCTYIQNPGFPTALTTTNALQYTVAKCDASVCSLRLDFETFTLMGPADTVETNGGTCVGSDTFDVTVQTSQVIPQICGQNTGQHIYVDIGAVASDTATLAFAFTGSSNIRQFDIKVTQIPCAANYAAPDGCLQYVTGLTGRLTTFNFLDATGSSHLALQQYTQCIRQEAGFCCIQYQTCADANSFSIDAQIAAPGNTLIDTQCTLDYVGIQGSSSNCQANTGGVTLTEKICGNFFNTLTGAAVDAVVCDCTPPFQVGIRTDNLQDANSATQSNRGVCLTFMQLPCN